MKNSHSAYFALTILVFVGLGCGSISPFSGSDRSGNAPSISKEKTTADKVVDSTVGNSKIGVPECDEVIALVEAEMNNPEDNFLVKAGKATILNRIKDGIRESVERNGTNTTELAKTCKEFKTQFDRYKSESANK